MKTNNSAKRSLVIAVSLLMIVINSCQAQIKPSIVVTDQNAFKVETKQVGNCTQQIPVGWQTASNKESSAMDIWDPANTMYAGYGVFAINANMGAYYDSELYNRDPNRCVQRMTAIMMNTQFKDGFSRFTDEVNEKINGYQLRSFATPHYKGVVLYRVFPGDGFNYTYIVATRIAITRSDLWEAKGPLLIGIAVNINCNTTIVQHESPVLPKNSPMKSSSSSSGSKSRKDEYGYNPQLGTEYCHNPATGENFRVSPDTHWSETGPDGPGYYGKSGNSVIKMAPGRSN